MTGHRAVEPGSRTNAAIGRAVRLVLLEVGGAHPPGLDKCTPGTLAKSGCAVRENECS